MVLDNVDDVDTFFPSQRPKQGEFSEASSVSLASYLPQSRNGSILITSRNKDAAVRLTGGSKYTRDVYAMEKSQGLQLLRNKLQDTLDEQHAGDLLHALDYMPLAITQAAAYINRRARMTLSDYLNEFRQNDKKKERLLNWEMGDLRRDESASNSIVTTWRMSFLRIYEERRSAANLLSLMSFFNPQGIPEAVLRRHRRSVVETSEEVIDEDEAISEFNEDFDILRAYSLVTATKEPGTCEMHALVQFCTRVWLSSDAERWKQKFLAVMAQEFPSGEFENWIQCQQLLPHIEPLYNTEPTADESLMDWARLLTYAAWYMWRKGSYIIAEKIVAKALSASERVLGSESELALVSCDILGLVLRDQGKYDDAEKLNRRSLEGFEKKLGVRHPVTLACMSHLASVLLDQRKYDESEKLSRQALEEREKVLGIHHSDTLTSFNDLATVLQHQGKYDEAEKLSRQTLEERGKVLGIHHIDTLTSCNDLALVLRNQGKYDEAEKLNRQVLEGYEKELGIQHPWTLTSLHNSALVLKLQGKYEESEKLNRQAVEGNEKSLGKYHRRTLVSVASLVGALRDQGKHEEAERLSRRALEGSEQELGIHHPDTLVNMNELALVLQRQERYEEAEKLGRRSLEGYEKNLGIRHPDTLTIMSNLASVLLDQGRDDEAETLYRRALEGRQNVLGVHHLDTLKSVKDLAVVLRYQGKYDEAEKLDRP